MKGRDDMPNDFHDEGERAGIHPPACPECMETRHEIMIAVFQESGALAESVALHLSRCASCREWESDLRRMSAVCGCAAEGADPSGLTAAALGASTGTAAAGEDAAAFAAAAGARTRDRDALSVVLVSIVLANAVFAALLGGGARILYPAVSLAAMLFATLWVYVDSRKREMRRGFWTALQAFTLPAGLVAYLVWRERESVRCPGCGGFVPSLNRFCPGCGRRLHDACCRCGKPVRREFHVCPWCGEPLSECSPREGTAGTSCGWSRAQIAFVVAANAAIIAAFAAAVFGIEAPASMAVAAAYLLALLPVFNWVALDSRRRAMDTFGWGLLALIAGYVGLLIYLACRRELVIECPVCGSYPPSSFNYCPCCGSLLRPSCPACGAAVTAQSYCAACGGRLR